MHRSESVKSSIEFLNFNNGRITYELEIPLFPLKFLQITIPFFKSCNKRECFEANILYFFS